MANAIHGLRRNVRNAFQGLEHNVRDLLNPALRAQARRQIHQKLEMVNAAALITAIACVAIFVFLPKILTALFLAPIFYLCYEVSTLALNFQGIVERFNDAWVAELNPRNFLVEATYGAPLTHYILNVIIQRARD